MQPLYLVADSTRSSGAASASASPTMPTRSITVQGANRADPTTTAAGGQPLTLVLLPRANPSAETRAVSANSLTLPTYADTMQISKIDPLARPLTKEGFGIFDTPATGRLTLPTYETTRGQMLKNEVTKRRQSLARTREDSDIPETNPLTFTDTGLPEVGTPAPMAAEGKMQTAPRVGGEPRSVWENVGSALEYWMGQGGRGILDTVDNVYNYIGGEVAGIGEALKTPFPETNEIQDFYPNLKEYWAEAKRRHDIAMSDAIDNSPNTYNINTREQLAEDRFEQTGKSDLVKIIGDIHYNIGRMAPAMAATGGLSGAVESAEVLGKLLSIGITAASSYVSALQQAKSEGAGLEESFNYALLSALIEGAGDQLIGGVGGLGEGAIDTAAKGTFKKLVSGITNPKLQAAITYMLKNVLGEGAEEVIQYVADIWAQRMTYNPDAVIDPSQLGYAAAMGGMIGGSVGSVEIPSYYRGAKAAAIGAEINQSPELVQSLIDEAIGDGYILGLPSSGAGSVKRLAIELDKKLMSGGTVSDEEIGALYYMNAAAKAARRVTDDPDAEQDSGQTNSDANASADIDWNAALSDPELTEADIADALGVELGEAGVDKQAGTGYNEGAGKLPQGLDKQFFETASQLIRDTVRDISDDIIVQGSRAAGTARADSDIDFAIRVSQEQFDNLIKQYFKTPNPGSAAERTRLKAIQTGKIQAGEAKLHRLSLQLKNLLGMDVHISIILKGGTFDNGATLPIR